MLQTAIEKALQRFALEPELRDIMTYAVLPAGKLFRPRLVEALSQDLCAGLNQDFLHLAAAIEIHHAYTLVHDDLPAMDNDLIRRGKPSTHARFGEWKAILAGDALLIASFEEALRIKHPDHLKILRLFTWATGARGLIAGQFHDLSSNGKLSIQQITRIHELKTARLIQVASLGSYYLSRTKNQREVLTYFRLGREIGVSFQFLDDLNELTEKEVSTHEQMINPFLIAPDKALGALASSHHRLVQILETKKLERLQTMLKDYFHANQQRLSSRLDLLEKNIPGPFDDIKNWITSFASV